MKSKSVLEKLLIILLILALILVIAQIFSRYVLHSSLSYTDEAVRYAFIWLVFWGIAFAQEAGEHIAFEFALFSGKLQKTLRRILMWLYYALFFYLGVKLVIFQIATKQRSAVLLLPMYIVSISMPLAVLYLFVRVIKKHD